MKKLCVPTIATLVASLAIAASASANPILMPTLSKEVKDQAAARGINPPPPPCPQYPSLSCTPVPEAFATTLPFPGNMAYYGGHVQTDPHLYLVYWGWGEAKAWPDGTNCTPADVSQTRADTYTFRSSKKTHASVRSVAGAPSFGSCWMNPVTGSPL